MEKKQTAVEWFFEQVNNLDWRNLIGDKKIEIFEQAKKLEAEQSKPHRIRVWHTRKLEQMLNNEEITYSRMVEILNEIAAGKHKDGIEI